MNIQEIIASTIISILPIGLLIPETDITCGGDFAGAFVNNKIYVCELNDGHTEFYKQHEVAHLIWSKLSNKQKAMYERIYKLHRKRGLNAFGRAYGYSDIEESFCEDYASYKTKERVNKYTQKRIKIILNILNSH